MRGHDANDLATPQVEVKASPVDRGAAEAVVIRPVGVRAQMNRGVQSGKGDIVAPLDVAKDLS